MKKQYSYNSVDSFYYPNTDMKIYEFNNLFFNNDKTETKTFEDLYFIISMGTNYSHAVLDGIGAYYQLKKIYPKLKPIFIEEEFKSIKLIKYINPTLMEFAKNNNYEIINFNDFNYIFKNVVLHSYYFSPVDIAEIEKDDVFGEHNAMVGIDFYKGSVKEVLSNTNIPPKINDKKIYLSRKFANKNRKTSNNIYSAKFLTYKEQYDEKIEELFANMGFDVVELEGFNLSQHIDIFSQCSYMVSMEGTGLLNGIWVPDDCKILSLKMFNMEFIWYDILKSCGKNNINLINLVDVPVNIGLNKILNYFKII